VSPVEHALVSAFLDGHSVDAAREIEAMGAPEAAEVLSSVPLQTAARVLGEMVPTGIRRCLEPLEAAVAGPILEYLPTTTAAAVLVTIDPSARENFLGCVSEPVARKLREVLAFPAGTIGRLIEPAANTVRAGSDPDAVRRAFADSGMTYLYVVDDDGKLRGVLSDRDFDRNPGPAPDPASERTVSLHSLMTVDAVRVHSAWLELDALPVVDLEGRLLGVLRHKRVRQSESRLRPPASLSGSAIDALVGLGEAYCSGLWEVIGPTTLQTEPKDTEPGGSPS
jgi:Mg/Co/Ni transporter MgtE